MQDIQDDQLLLNQDSTPCLMALCHKQSATNRNSGYSNIEIRQCKMLYSS